MNKAVAPTSLLLICAAVALGVQNSAWINYNSTEGRYTISLPAQPKLGTQESATADGQKFTQYKAMVEDQDAIYLVGHFDHVQGTTFSADRARDGMVAAVKGTLVSERTIHLSGYPGRELKVSAKLDGTDYILLAKFWDTENRVYVLQLIFPKSLEGDALNAKAARYFDSFHILQK